MVTGFAALLENLQMFYPKGGDVKVRVFSAVPGIESRASHVPGKHSAFDTSPGVKTFNGRKGGGHLTRTGHPGRAGRTIGI